MLKNPEQTKNKIVQWMSSVFPAEKIPVWRPRCAQRHSERNVSWEF